MSQTIFQKASVVAIAASLLTGCATGVNNAQPVATYPNNTNTGGFNGIGGLDRNTTIGTGTGAALGGIIGAAVASKGKKNEGALIGAALGGVVGGMIGNQYGQRIDQQIGQLGSVLNGTGANVTKMADGSMKINLAGDVSFNSGSALIKDSFQSTLNNVARIINQTPNSRVVVVGHTDNSGYEESNVRLSLARATSVRDYLVSSGTASSRISTSGRGSSQAIADNSSEAGRAQNRRVEIFVFPDTQQ